jgi:DNA-3-methyladenine glycosylase
VNCGLTSSAAWATFSELVVRLALRFYNRPALTVARELLGKVIVHELGGNPREGRIVETEAYVGEHDRACHASKGRTKRTEVLFGPPGRAYVYFIYGMYHCFNVVTEPEGIAAAVLVRAVEPLAGIPRGLATNGPGKLCRALEITLLQNREDLCGKRLYIEDAPRIPMSMVARGPRIGVDYAGAWARRQYRFWIRGNPFVSGSRSAVRST